MARFIGFKPEGMRKIASKMGYQGSMSDFDNYLQQNPEKQRQMIVYESMAKQMARGGVVKMQEGGIMNISSPGFDPRYEGFTQQSSGQQNRIPTFDYLYGQTSPDSEPFYRPQPGETLYRTDQAAMAENPNYPGFIARSAVEPREGGQYAHTRTGERVTVPLGFFGTPEGENRFSTTIDQRTAPQLVDPRDNVTTPTPTPTTPNVPTSQVDSRDARQLPQADVPVGTSYTPTTGIGEVFTDRAQMPSLPEGGVTIPIGTQLAQEQFLQGDLGQLTGRVGVPTTLSPTTTAQIQQERNANLTSAQMSAPAVDSALSATQAAQTSLEDSRAKVLAAQQTASSVGNLNAAQGQATLLQNPIQRQIEQGELISSTANAETASKFTEQIQAATATPTSQATVAGQLASLTANFDANNPPAWAAGAIRGVQAVMQQRGLGASSIAGQALVQAAMESALPVAQADASIFAQFENQNLSNRQQRAMLAAQQRAQFIGQEFDQSFQARVQNAAKVSDIANVNFNAEQQIALENSRATNTMNLNNLSNRQAIVLAEASALANMDLSNLSNRQQAAVQNAQSFLQQDMANLTNLQQTELFKAQQRTQSLFTDQAVTNAANQFNATSQNQVDQFFSQLAQQASQFNATQANAQAQFNAGQVNTVERFNAEINNQRDQFNAQNQLAIAQNNAVWRREIATADTVSINRANELNANAVLDISKEAYDNLWSHYNDTMEWAWTSADNQLDRINALAVAEVGADIRKEIAAMESSSAAGSAVGNLIGTLGSAAISKGLFGGGPSVISLG